MCPLTRGLDRSIARFPGSCQADCTPLLARMLGYDGASMTLRAAAIGLPLLLCACAPAPESHSKAFLGAVLIDGRGGPPLSNSIVLTAADRIRAAGPRSSIPIPGEADKIDGSGKCIVPTPVDACARADPPDAIHAAT